MDFCCPNRLCRRDAAPLRVEIPSEALMDEQNMATLFCPRCRGPLVPCIETAGKDALAQNAPAGS